MAGRRNHSAFGSKRERQVRDRLREEGWIVIRCAASKPCDLVALRPQAALLVEVKGTSRSPWVAWGPADRAALLEAARRAGAKALLAWWPPHGELQLLGPAEWPT